MESLQESIEAINLSEVFYQYYVNFKSQNQINFSISEWHSLSNDMKEAEQIHKCFFVSVLVYDSMCIIVLSIRLRLRSPVSSSNLYL